jgi:alkylation response protein AidB-like acyl-CoA dehydrogenase
MPNVYGLDETERKHVATAETLAREVLAKHAVDVDREARFPEESGAAFSRHLPVERLFRDARAGWVMAPTVDHLQDFVGKALTGLPLF